ncbi:MAG: hypothetical protein AVDCRST_MAG10-3559, partial [uncultured Acidimicrobiales bacterium]
VGAPVRLLVRRLQLRASTADDHHHPGARGHPSGRHRHVHPERPDHQPRPAGGRLHHRGARRRHRDREGRRVGGRRHRSGAAGERRGHWTARRPRHPRRPADRAAL